MTTTAERDELIAVVDRKIERANIRSDKAMIIVNEEAAKVAVLDARRKWLSTMPTDDSIGAGGEVVDVAEITYDTYSSASNGEVSADSYR